MTAQRVVFSLVLALQAGCLTAVQQNVFPKWTAFFILGGTILQAFMSSVAVPAEAPKP